jgi:hypothetical protein
LRKERDEKAKLLRASQKATRREIRPIEKEIRVFKRAKKEEIRIIIEENEVKQEALQEEITRLNNDILDKYIEQKKPRRIASISNFILKEKATVRYGDIAFHERKPESLEAEFWNNVLQMEDIQYNICAYLGPTECHNLLNSSSSSQAKLLPVIRKWCTEFVDRINCVEISCLKENFQNSSLIFINSILSYMSVFLKKYITTAIQFESDTIDRYSKNRVFGHYCSHEISDSFFLISLDGSIISPIKLDNIFYSHLRFEKIYSKRMTFIDSKLNIEPTPPMTGEDLLTSSDIEEMRLKSIKTWNSTSSVSIFLIDQEGDIRHYDQRRQFYLCLFQLSSSCDSVIRNAVLNDWSLLKRFYHSLKSV